MKGRGSFWVALLLAGCGASSKTETGRPGPPQGSLARLAGVPLISVTHDDFSGEPGGAARLSDGQLVFVDWGAKAVFFFAPNGTLAARSGRPGSGPGEFQGPQLVQVLPGDTVVVWDQVLRRVSWLDRTGRLVSEMMLDPRESYGPQPVVGLLSDGDLLIRHESLTGRDSAGLQHQTVTLRSVGRDGRTTREVGTYAAGWVSPKGYRFFSSSLRIRTTGDRIYLGANERWRIVEISPAGDTTQVFDAPWSPRLVSESDRETMRRVFAERRAVPDFTDPDRFAPTVPAFGPFFVDPAGVLWVAEFVAPYQAPGHLDLFGARGARIGRVALPPRFLPADIGTDYVAGWRRDAEDAVHVEVYPLVRDQ